VRRYFLLKRFKFDASAVSVFQEKRQFRHGSKRQPDDNLLFSAAAEYTTKSPDR